MRTISQKKFDELNDYLEYDGVDEAFFSKLHEATGITASPYTSYNLYDEDDNYLCDSCDIDLYDLLMQAGIGIRRENLND